MIAAVFAILRLILTCLCTDSHVSVLSQLVSVYSFRTTKWCLLANLTVRRPVQKTPLDS